MSVLANVLQLELAGTAVPCPGGACESPAHDSNTPSRAFEGALNEHPSVSKMCWQSAALLGREGSHAFKQNMLLPLKLYAERIGLYLA